MTLLVPIMMFGWIPLSIMLFQMMPARRAVLISVIGGVLFLPMASYDLPGIPAYTKATAISLGLMLGGFFSREKRGSRLVQGKFDLPMLFWCFFCPVATSLSNGLGLYDGLSGSLQHVLNWGVFYWAGRKYFQKPSCLRDICLGIVVGGLIYVPLCIFEMRMSPMLSSELYGFFPHSWHQHFRYGGYRPIVFMQHGLMVALWMALSFTVSFWLWRNKLVPHIKGFPMSLGVLFLFVITIFCKSANGWFFLMVGIVTCFHYRKSESTLLLRMLIIAIIFYVFARITNIVPLDLIVAKASLLLESDRVRSLSSRLIQEDLFSMRALERPILGWGGWGRGWPIDPDTGESVLRAVDALWVIVFSSNGFAGMLFLFLAMLIGPWCVLRKFRGRLNTIIQENHYNFTDAVIISLVVLCFMIDSLFNGMVNPVYILCAGALVSYHLSVRNSIEEGHPVMAVS